MKHLPAISLGLLAATCGLGAYSLYQQHQEAQGPSKRRAPLNNKYLEHPVLPPVTNEASPQLFTARTRFRILRSSAPDLFQPQTEEMAVQAHSEVVKGEQAVMRIRSELATLKRVKSGPLFDSTLCFELRVSDETLQKLISDYALQVSSRQAALTGGFGPNHPALKALDQSIAHNQQELVWLSEPFQRKLEVQLEISQKMLDDARARETAEKNLTPATQPDPSLAVQARLYAAKLEEDVQKMRTTLKTLEGLQGEDLFAAAADLGVSSTGIQKLYPEYQQELATRQATLTAGFGPDDPKIKALDQSIATMRKKLEQASDLFRQNLKIQIETSQKMLDDSKARAATPKPAPDPWLQTQIKALSSPNVLIRAVNRLHLDAEWKLTEEQSVARIQESMDVKLTEGTNVAPLTVWSSSKTTSANIANAVRDAYEEARMEMGAERERRLNEYVKARLEEQERKVEEARIVVDETVVLKEPEEAQTPGVTPSTEASDYAAAHGMQRYESSLMLLNTIRELSARQRVSERPEKPIEIIEIARPGFP